MPIIGLVTMKASVVRQRKLQDDFEKDIAERLTDGYSESA
jgi:hypothetical protein